MVEFPSFLYYNHCTHDERRILDYILELRFEADDDEEAKKSHDMVMGAGAFHSIESDLLYRLNKDGSREGIE